MKVLTIDAICEKVRPHRSRFLILVDEVDDFLDRDKLVFNICSNKNNDLKKQTLEQYYAVCKSVYEGQRFDVASSFNAEYSHTYPHA